MSVKEQYMYRVKRYWHDWSIWQCAVPVLVIILTWPIGSVISEAKHCFLRTFSDGSLLLYSGMLLVGASLEIKKIQTGEMKVHWNVSLNFLAQVALAGSLIVLIIYGAIKTDMMRTNYFLIDPLPDKVLIYSIGSIIITIGSISFASYGFWKTSEALLKEVST